MRFLVAPDSFKGTFEASDVAAAVAAGIEAGGGLADRCPVADGGEGTMAVLMGALGGERRRVEVHDPLRRPVEASFGLLGGGETAIVEAAQASGLGLVAPAEREPERADTFGTGELIAAALASGARTVLVAAGGSATTDGGRGAIEALRRHWTPRRPATPPPRPETGAGPHSADPPPADPHPSRAGLLEAAGVEVLCDVRAPFEDAARLFGPQKGADAAAVERLSARLQGLAAELPRDPRGVPMSGCAGGLSGGLWSHGACLRSGADFVLDAIGFDRRLAAADAVVGGEGRLDAQSLAGKIVGAIAGRCARAGKPLHLIVGGTTPDAAPPAAISSITRAESLEEMRRAGCDLARRR